ncbi:MAG: cory-CC-star protein [Leptospirales bacterium]
MKKKWNNRFAKIFIGIPGKVSKAVGYYENLFYGPYKQSVLKDIREQDDLFMMFLFSEELGIPNPIMFYMLEAYPFLMEHMHEWHLRMGMEKSPFEGLSCC